MTMRAAGYVRVSTAEQAEEGFSLGEQERRVRAHAEAQGWTLERVYVDGGVSGGVPFADRPAGGEVVAGAADLDRLIVVKLDRLGRSAPDLLATIERFAAAGCDVVSVSESIDTATPTGRLLRTVLAGTAEFERDRISERVREGERAKAAAGRPHGGPRPFGYRYEDGLVAVEAEAVVVRRIFSEFVGGASITAITRNLERDKIPTVRGGRWQTTTVSGILRGVRYAGLIEHNGERFEATHEPLVALDTFRRAEQLLASNTTCRPGRPPRGRHLFRRGMLRCECGGPMVPRTDHRSEYYACHTRLQHGTDQCAQSILRRADIDSAVFRFFATVGLDLEATRAQLAGEGERKLAEVGALLDQAQREEFLAGERLGRVRRDYTDGRLGAEDWVDLRGELTAERQSAHAEVERLTAALADVERDSDLGDAEQDTLRLLAEIRKSIAGEVNSAEGVDAVRAAMAALFSDFIVHLQRTPRYEGRGRADLVDVDATHMIELRVRPAVLTGYSDRGLYPVLVREPLRAAENNQSVGSATR
jgi:DNA invertase Pin-like site-specific DNA recombinase